MIRRDYAQIVQIEQASFPSPWTEDDFVQTLNARNSIGTVAEIHERIVGYVVYSMFSKEIIVYRIAIDPAFRRQRVGAMLVNKLIAKSLASHNRDLVCIVEDSNLPAHLFLRQCGFFCESIIRGYYESEYSGLGDDAYFFRWSATDWVADNEDDCGDDGATTSENHSIRKRNGGR